ncbi:MAG: 1-deoxy-D-xylulose-5-phosphate synthase [Bacilli bacterium]
MSNRIIDQIKQPSDIKKLDKKELKALADELREVIVNTVSKNGGHLSSNLGVVELTLALHRCFSSPEDKIIFDVGHQSYVHKLLTGRYENFASLRQMNGISGFQNKEESEHDPFTEGHAGTALSQALGIAEANKIKGNNAWSIAVVGDGAFTNGMVFEAINNCSKRHINLIIILNDNEMSISPNIGGIHHHFTRLRNSSGYLGFKRGLTSFLRKIPLLGRPLYKLIKLIKNGMKRLLIGRNIFDCFDIGYLGPVDGNNIKKLSILLQEAKKRENEVTLIHVKTIKGKGYEPAEKEPSKYHGVSKFDKDIVLDDCPSESFSTVFGHLLVEKAKKDEKICAITAAMKEGTGLSEFASTFKDRFFDVGIAEEHAITFGGGLAYSSLKPVCAIYSTFAQRSFDQLFHDITLQKLPFVLVLDRSGIVPSDGITHQGIFDYSIFSTLRNTVIYAIDTYEELDKYLEESLNSSFLSIIRIPKGKETCYQELDYPLIDKGDFKCSSNFDNATSVILTYGRIAKEVILSIKEINDDSLALVKMNKIYPLDVKLYKSLFKGKKNLYIIEEGIKSGGYGEKVSSLIKENNIPIKVKIKAINEYVEHGSVEELWKKHGLCKEDIINFIKN